MATCKFCGTRKGSRRCPGLEARICVQCCEQHQGKEIECPADCQYLGRVILGPGSVASARAPGLGFTAETIEVTLGLVLDFAEREGSSLDEADDEFYGPSGTAEGWEQGIRIAHSICGYRDEQGECAVERMLRQRGPALAVDLRACLEGLVAAWCSVFEVIEVREGTGVLLRDRVLDVEVSVISRLLAGSVDVGEFLFLWAVPAGEGLFLHGPMVQLDDEVQADLIVADLRDEMQQARNEGSKANDRELLTGLGWVAWIHLRDVEDEEDDLEEGDIEEGDDDDDDVEDGVEDDVKGDADEDVADDSGSSERSDVYNRSLKEDGDVRIVPPSASDPSDAEGRRLPRLLNADGDEVARCVARFRATNAAAALASLARLSTDPRFKLIDGQVRMLDPTGRKGANDEVATIGTVAHSGNELFLDTNSPRRLELGRKVLTELLGASIEHLGDEVTSIAELLRSVEPSPGKGKPRGRK